MNPAFTDDEIGAVASVLKVLGHDVRLKLMRTLLAHGETSVGELEALAGVGQPGLSQQLAILRKAGLVQTRRDAKLIFYSLAPEALPDAARLISALAGVSSGDKLEGGKKAPSPAGSAATFARIL
ncbi:MAG: metalloregulator ArsR/SmtB family transcription factor [Sphingomonadaceae bacterium]